MTPRVVFLDWLGVVADRDCHTTKYRQLTADELTRRYGGTVERWLTAHDVGWAFWQSAWEERRMGERSTGYRAALERLSTEWLHYVLTAGGVDSAPAGPTLLEIVNELDYTVAARIDCAYPDAARGLYALKATGAVICNSAGGGRASLLGSLVATGLAGFYDRLTTPEEVDAFKMTDAYWERVVGRVPCEPADALAVDDKVKVLEAAKRVGIYVVLMDRAGRYREAPAGMVLASSLLDLPPLLEELG